MISQLAPHASVTRPNNTIREKWGDALMAGFQVVPNTLIRAQKKLGLDAVDVIVLLNLNLHWWGPHDLPYPRPAIIASRMGLSRRTVERRLQRLESRGFIERLSPSAGNGGASIRRYRLDGLVQLLRSAAAVEMSRRTEYKVSID